MVLLVFGPLPIEITSKGGKGYRLPGNFFSIRHIPFSSSLNFSQVDCQCFLAINFLDILLQPSILPVMAKILAIGVPALSKFLQISS